MSKKTVMSIIGPLIFLVLSASLLFIYEFYMKDKINTVPVLVASKDIGFKDKFTVDNLKVEYIRREHAIDNGIQVKDVKNAVDVLNYYAAIDIKRGTQIYTELVDHYNLIPDESKGEFVAPVPKEWIFSLPGSIRKSYVADFYLIAPNNETEILLERIKDQLNEDKKENTSETENENTEGDNVRTHSEKEEEEFIKEQLNEGNKPLLTNVRLFAAKDNSNKEVVNVENNKTLSKDASGVINSIEIIATEEQLNLLKEYMSKGYKLYITYTFERGE